MLSKDFNIAKNKRQLGKYFATRTFHFLKKYRGDKAAQVSISIPQHTSILGGIVNIEIESNNVKLDQDEREITLIRIGRANGASKFSAFMGKRSEENAVVILDAKVIINGVEFKNYFLRSEEDVLCLAILSEEAPKDIKDILIRIRTPSIYYAYLEPEPFTRTVLDFHINIPFASKVLFALYYPRDLGLRGRLDNSEFLTFPLMDGSNGLLYYFFFPTNNVSLKCFFGDTDPSRLISPALPLISVGLSLMALGYSYLLAQKSLWELASTVFALSLLPTLYQFILHRRSFWPDPDLTTETYEKRLGVFSLAVYIPLLLITSLSLASLLTTTNRFWTAILINLAQIDIGLGALFCIGFLLFWVLLNLGVLQNFTCDYKEHRLWIRDRAILHLPTRKSVCKEHYSDLITEEKAQQTNNEF